jgi:iron complex transport system permease protein
MKRLLFRFLGKDGGTMESIQSVKTGVAVKAAKNQSKEEQSLTVGILILILAGAVAVSLMMGRYFISFGDLLNVLKVTFLGKDATAANLATLQTVLFQVRLPRIIGAVLIGGALAVSGSAYQGMFRNPMVSPDILGSAAGAGFGAALGILLSIGILGIQALSFGFGLLAVGLTYLIALRFDRNQNATLVLVLAGMVIATLFSACISLIKYVADPYSKLPAITFWLMGSLASLNLKDIGFVSIPVVIGAIPLLLFRWKLNVLSFGEEEAQALGVDTKRLRTIVIFCATLMTAAAVSVSGLIGWVGLIIPHLTRMLVGPNYKALLPTSILIGGIYLLVVDDLARNLFAMEIPLGILTALLGAPFFLYLLMKGRKGWV